MKDVTVRPESARDKQRTRFRDKIQQKNPGDRNEINFKATEMKAIHLETSNKPWINGK